MSEPELIFHDSVPIEEENLPGARVKAENQKEFILEIFKDHWRTTFTPDEIQTAYHLRMRDLYKYGKEILLTSVRRSISDLTKEGRLIKCQWSESRKGMYGKLNRTWKYNTEYIKPLNPQK
jgi:hypothetical protein